MFSCFSRQMTLQSGQYIGTIKAERTLMNLLDWLGCFSDPHLGQLGSSTNLRSVINTERKSQQPSEGIYKVVSKQLIYLKIWEISWSYLLFFGEQNDITHIKAMSRICRLLLCFLLHYLCKLKLLQQVWSLQESFENKLHWVLWPPLV